MIDEFDDTRPAGPVDDDQFAVLVKQEAFGKAPAGTAEWLRMEGQLERWRDALADMVTSAEQILQQYATEAAEKRAACFAMGRRGSFQWAEWSANHEVRRSKQANFKMRIVARLTEVNRLRRAVNIRRSAAAKAGTGTEPGLSPPSSQDARFFRSAIARHRELTDAEYDPTPLDKALWATLDGIWLFDDLNLNDG